MSQSESFDQTHFIALSGSDKTIKPGDIVGDHYALLSLLGEGGMGYVFLAEHNIIGKKYALKIVRPDRLDDTSKQRFETEARVIARLDHPNIVKIYNMGVYLEDCPYYVMDLLDGKALSEHIQEGTNFKIEELLNIFKQVAQGLDYAHKKGIVHRDIKPSNIVLTAQKDGYRAQLVDFGIAKVVNQDIVGQARTATGLIFGTPYYMSPEQCLGQKIDGRSDIYSLGCTLYECLHGEPPFKGQNAMHTMMMHQESPTPVLRQPTSDPALNQSINFLIAKMTAKPPQMRYQSMQQISHDIERMLQGKPVALTLDGPDTDDEDSDGPIESGGSKRIALITITLACSIALLSVFAIYNPATQSALKSALEQVATIIDMNHPAPSKAVDVPLDPATEALKAELARLSPIKATAVKVNGMTKRRFEFPRQGIGTIIDSDGIKKAAGTVTVSADYPLQLRIFEKEERTAFALPETFKAIGKDQIVSLSLQAMPLYKETEDMSTEPAKVSLARLNAALSNLTEWSALTIIILNDFTINKQTIERLENLPKLNTLWLMSPTYEVDDLLKSKILDRLTSFAIDCPHPENIDPILPKLAKVPILLDLKIRKADFSGKALEQLAHCHTLKALSIDDLLMTDEMLQSILKLKISAINLTNIDLSDSQLQMINDQNCKNVKVYDMPPERLPALKARYPQVRFGGHTEAYTPLPD